VVQARQFCEQSSLCILIDQDSAVTKLYYNQGHGFNVYVADEDSPEYIKQMKELGFYK
jgi:hypothetical protein